MTRYLQPGVRSEADALVGSPITVTGPLVPGIIGRSSGASTLVSSEEVTKGVTGSSESLLNTPVNSVSRIANSANGVNAYQSLVDFTVSNNSINWINTVIPTPTPVTPIAVAGGSLIAGTRYYYVITAYKEINVLLTPNTLGETGGVVNTDLMEVSFLATAVNKTVTVGWKQVPGATGYKVWRTTVSGDYTGVDYGEGHLLTTILSGTTLSYTDDGTGTLGTTGLPTTNNAYKQPATGADYYVDYYTTTYSYYEPTLFYQLSDVYLAHGETSPIGIAAKLILGKSGLGNGASAMYICAVEYDTYSAYQVALTAYEKVDVNILVPLMVNTTFYTALLNHCVEMSNTFNGKERRCVVSLGSSAESGDSVTSGTFIYVARSLNNQRAVLVAPGGAYAYVGSGSAATEQLLEGQYIAAAVAGRQASLDDAATPMTKKFIQGFTRLATTYSIAEANNLAVNGVLVLEAVGTQIQVRHALTTAIDTEEHKQMCIGYAEDYMINLLRDNVEKYIGNKIVAFLLTCIENTVEQGLGSLISDAIIQNFINLSVEQDSSLSTQINVSFAWKPVYPSDYILFKYSYDLS